MSRNAQRRRKQRQRQQREPRRRPRRAPSQTTAPSVSVHPRCSRCLSRADACRPFTRAGPPFIRSHSLPCGGPHLSTCHRTSWSSSCD
ncbi:hypothetical protein ES703_91709 [subsurface metagenome]